MRASAPSRSSARSSSALHLSDCARARPRTRSVLADRAGSCGLPATSNNVCVVAARVNDGIGRGGGCRADSGAVFCRSAKTGGWAGGSLALRQYRYGKFPPHLGAMRRSGASATGSLPGKVWPRRRFPRLLCPHGTVVRHEYAHASRVLAHRACGPKCQQTGQLDCNDKLQICTKGTERWKEGRV
jgi:hypothetical protein